jgi:hypothetical protein
VTAIIQMFSTYLSLVIVTIQQCGDRTATGTSVEQTAFHKHLQDSRIVNLTPFNASPSYIWGITEVNIGNCLGFDRTYREFLGAYIGIHEGYTGSTQDLLWSTKDILASTRIYSSLNQFTSQNRKTKSWNVRFEVFTAVTMKNGVFWDVTCVGC